MAIEFNELAMSKVKVKLNNTIPMAIDAHREKIRSLLNQGVTGFQRERKELQSILTQYSAELDFFEVGTEARTQADAMVAEVNKMIADITTYLVTVGAEEPAI